MVKYKTIIRVVVGVIAPRMMPMVDASLNRFGKIPEQLEEEVDKRVKRGEACETAREIVARYEVSESVTEFIRTHHSSIGTDIHRGNQAKCGEFTKAYLRWLAEKCEVYAEVPIPDIPKINLPSMPSMPSISLIPGGTGGLKRSLQVTGLFVVAVVLIIVYMLTGRGGEKGGVTVVT